jgi:hypothetical protein
MGENGPGGIDPSSPAGKFIVTPNE